MKVIKNKILLMISILLMVTPLAGCSSDVSPTKNDIYKCIEEAISLDMSYDQIANITYKESETTSEQVSQLQQLYTGAVPFQAYSVSAIISTISTDIVASYDIVATYYGDEWSGVIATPKDKDSWKYEPKDFASKSTIMKSLKTQKVGDFELGYVGGNSTSIEIVDRVLSDDKKTDVITCDISVSTDFGINEFSFEIAYQLDAGSWTLSSIDIPQPSEWNFTYDGLIDEPVLSLNSVEHLLISSDKFLTYAVNKDYTSNTSMTYSHTATTQTSMSYIHKYEVQYDGFFNIDYIVTTKYDMNSYEWSDGLTTVTIDNIDASELAGKKFSVGTKYVQFNDSLSRTESTVICNELDIDATHPIVFNVTYFDGQDTTDKQLLLNIELRDNNYTIIDLSESPLYDISLDIKNKSITINNNQYK